MDNVTTFYLEMKSPSQLIPKDTQQSLRIVECEVKQFQFNRFLYAFVGEQWDWTDKLSWSDEAWRAYAENDNLRTWLATFKGSPAGYFELQQLGEDVEIAYFGLAPNFIGMGFGGQLLTEAIRQAWAWQGTKRVWVHTCTLDHPSALSNYKARGMIVYKIDGSHD